MPLQAIGIPQGGLESALLRRLGAYRAGCGITHSAILALAFVLMRRGSIRRLAVWARRLWTGWFTRRKVFAYSFEKQFDIGRIRGIV